MPLTEVGIKAAKPSEKPFKLGDGGGLFLLVNPNGSRLWRMAYRFDGKQKLLAFGAYPEITLKSARDKREAARRALAEGMDPGEQKRLAKLTRRVAAENTFAAVAAELLAKKAREGKATATLAKLEWLVAFATPTIGKRPIAEISPAEILDVLRRVERRGRLESARRLRSVIGEVFRYAIATARAKDDPTYALRGALTTPKVKHRAAITDPTELGALLRAVDGFKGQPATVAALRLIPLLFPRPGELRMAEWTEFDMGAAVWTIPASRTKMRREHRVPLPAQALAILRELHAFTGGGRLVFPGVGRGSRPGRPMEPRPISENTLNAALRRLGYGVDEVTAHGFRATATTLLNECGKWSRDAIERALAHQDEDDVRRAYARGEHWKERVAMAAWWADYLDTLRTGAKVISLSRTGQ